MNASAPVIASQVVAIGASTGGLGALQTILSALPADFPAALLIVQHRKAAAKDLLSEILGRTCLLGVQEATDKMLIRTGQVYLAPANYHLLVERDYSLSLSIDERVSYARPSIDVLFETAAEAYGKNLVGVLLTGANHDGTAGFRRIKAQRGLTIAQDPETAEAQTMPQSAIQAGVVDLVLSLEKIAGYLKHYFERELSHDVTTTESTPHI